MHTLTFSFHPKYFWSSLIALLLHSTCGARVDSDAALNDRHPRHNGYRGNARFQVPAYLNPDAYSQTSYSTDHRSSDGTFGYEYETTNGIKVKQDSTGYGPNKVVRGYYSYIGSDGVPYTVNYIADRFGYRAYGAHLPTQPDASYEQPRPQVPVYVRPVNNQVFVSSTQAPPQSYNRPGSNQVYVSSTPAPAYSYNRPGSNQVYVSSTPAPVYNRPVNSQGYITSTPTALSVHPLQSQHQTQTAYYPQESIQSHPIYVAEPSPANYISITPKPFNNRSPILSQPIYNVVTPSTVYQAPPPFAWTTARPTDYNGGFVVSTPRPLLPY